MGALVTELRDRVGKIAQGGGERAVSRHVSRGICATLVLWVITLCVCVCVYIYIYVMVDSTNSIV